MLWREAEELDSPVRAARASLGLGWAGWLRWGHQERGDNTGACGSFLGVLGQQSCKREHTVWESPGLAPLPLALAHSPAQGHLIARTLCWGLSGAVEPSVQTAGRSQGRPTAVTTSPHTELASCNTLYFSLMSQSSWGFCPLQDLIEWGVGRWAEPLATAQSRGSSECRRCWGGVSCVQEKGDHGMVTTPTPGPLGHRSGLGVSRYQQQKKFQRHGVFWLLGLSLVAGQESLQSSLWWGIN